MLAVPVSTCTTRQQASCNWCTPVGSAPKLGKRYSVTSCASCASLKISSQRSYSSQGSHALQQQLHRNDTAQQAHSTQQHTCTQKSAVRSEHFITRQQLLAKAPSQPYHTTSCDESTTAAVATSNHHAIGDMARQGLCSGEGGALETHSSTQHMRKPLRSTQRHADSCSSDCPAGFTPGVPC